MQQVRVHSLRIMCIFYAYINFVYAQVCMYTVYMYMYMSCTFACISRHSLAYVHGVL
jgi:hypothetical protein